MKSSNVYEHLLSRGFEPNRASYINPDTWDVYFFSYNLSGELVGFEKYNPLYPKIAQSKSEIPTNVRYYQSHGVDKISNIWGLDTINDSFPFLFITEGVFDINFIHRMGLGGISTGGATLSECKVNFINTLPHIKIVIRDNDEISHCLNKVADYTFDLPNYVKDLNEMGFDKTQIFINNILNKLW